MRGSGLVAVVLVVTALFTSPARSAESCDVGAVAYSIAYLPNVTKTLGGSDGWVTPFIVQNTGTESTTIEISFFRFSDGSLVICRRVANIAAGTSYADIPNNDPDLPGDTQFAVVIRSLVTSIVVVVNESRGRGASTQSASYVGVSAGARRVYLPNVTKHFYGYGVPFIVQNVGDSLSSITASFTSFDGSQQLSFSRLVTPGRSTVFDPDALSGLHDATQFSVVVTSDQPVAVVANAHNEAAGPVAYAHNGLTTGGTIVFAPYVAKSGAGTATDRDSPVVIQNVSANPVDVELRFIPLGATDPDSVAQTFNLFDLPSLQAFVFDPRFAIRSTTPCGSAQAGLCLGPGEYSLKMTSDGPITAVVLPASATSAAAYVAQPSVTITPHVFLPNVTRNLGGAAGWTTPVVVHSDTATNIVLRWYRFTDGALVKSESRRFIPGTSIWIDPRTVAGLSDDAQYALDIRGELGTAGAKLSAIVYELATGGDSAMIYEGFAGN